MNNSLEKKIWIFIFFTSVLSFLWIAYNFILHWQIYYTADYAMIGLMAKRVIEEGVQEIFVWGAGYMGSLIHVNLIALFFKLFGMSEYTLNFAPALIFIIFIVIFYFYLRSITNALPSILCVFILIMSTPYLYGKVLRTAPNYGEVFIIGILLMWIYQKLISDLICGIESFFLKKQWPRFLAFGFLTGLGLYIYGQVIFFIGALFLHFLVLCFMILKMHQAKKHFIKFILVPNYHKALKWFAYVLFVFLFFGLFFWVSDKGSFSFFGVTVKFNSLALVCQCVIALFLLHFIQFFLIFREKVIFFISKYYINIILFVFLLFVGFVFGYSPVLYYKYILNLPTNAEVFIFEPHFAKTLLNAKLYFLGVLHFLNLYNSGISSLFLRIVLGIFYGIVLLISFRFLFRVEEESGHKGLLLKKMAQLSPIVFLPLTTFILFVLSKRITDESHFRYMLSVLLTLVFLTGFGVYHIVFLLYNNVRFFYNRVLFSFVIFLLSLGVFNNYFSFYHLFQKSDRGAFWYSLADKLKSESILIGYSDYWFSHIINFLTKEGIVLIPVNYHNPYHHLAPTHKSAYIDVIPSWVSFNGDQQVVLNNHLFNKIYTISMDGKNAEFSQDFRIQELAQSKGYFIHILERVNE